MASHILRNSSRASINPVPLRHSLNPAITHRYLTTSPSLHAEGTNGDLGNPQSSSNEQAGVKTSRATKDQISQDSASLAQPVSNRSAIPGNKDEGTPTEDAVKRDPKEPAEKKRESVEKQGEKPLGPEDHQ